MESAFFTENTLPADKYARDGSPQGVAMVVQNTGLSEVGKTIRSRLVDSCFEDISIELSWYS